MGGWPVSAPTITARIAEIRAATERHLAAVQRRATALAADGVEIVAIHAAENGGRIHIAAPLSGAWVTWTADHVGEMPTWHFAHVTLDGVSVGGCRLDWPSALAAGCPATLAPPSPAPVSPDAGEGGAP